MTRHPRGQRNRSNAGIVPPAERSFPPAAMLAAYAVAFATGAAGLVYEVAWQRYLTRLLGADTTATAIVLATFLGGLSLGYYLCGRITARDFNHARGYALLEGIIGGWGLIFPFTFAAVESITRPWSFSAPLTIIFQGLVCSIALMAVPTICMGATIPFLTRMLSGTIENATRTHARVYAVNTAGAFVGALLAGFYLIPQFGLPATMQITACVNLWACVCFYALSLVFRQGAPEGREAAVPAAAEKPSPPAVFSRAQAIYAVAFLSGFYVMTLENVLIRIVNLSLGSSSYSFSLIVAAFIFSIALGSAVVGRMKAVSPSCLFFNQLLIVLSLLGVYLSLDTWPYWAHVVRILFQSHIAGFWGYYLCVLVLLTALLLLPVSLMGATVPIAFEEIKRELGTVGQYSGRLFAVNTMGNLLGSLAGGIVLYHLLDSSGVFLCALVLAAVSVVLAGWHPARRSAVLAGAVSAPVLLLLAAGPFYEQSRFMSGAFRHKEPLAYSFEGPAVFFRELHRNFVVRYYWDGPAGTVSVLEDHNRRPSRETPLSIIVNGKPDSSTVYDAYTLKLAAHLPALLAETREKIMVIGLGTGVTAGELTLYPDIGRIDVAEISPGVVEALPHFKQANHDPGRDPRVSIHMGDAFRIIGRSRERWDVVISEPSNPWVTGVDQLFTREFYRMVKDHLTPGGMLLQWVQAYAFEPAMLGMIVRTLKTEFAHCRVFVSQDHDLLILASNRDVSADDIRRAEATLARNERLRESLEAVNLGVVDAILIREIWSSSYTSEISSQFALQTMDRPRLHYLAGKSFFLGTSIPDGFLLAPETAGFCDDYLIVRRHGQWADLPFSPETFEEVLKSLRSRYVQQDLPMRRSLALKAHLSRPDLYPLSLDEQRQLAVELIPSITGEAHDPPPDREAGSYRERARALLSHVDRFRNWIVPYPMNGLRALLEEGMVRAEDVHERNWCALQTAQLMLLQGEDPQRIAGILAKTSKDSLGGIILEEGDTRLRETVLKRLARRIGATH